MRCRIKVLSLIYDTGTRIGMWMRVSQNFQNRLRSRIRVTTLMLQITSNDCWRDAIVNVSSAASLTCFHICMLEVKNPLRSRIRVTSFMFQTALSLKNRLRFRTRVTSFMFRSALSLKNRPRSVVSLWVRCERAVNGLWTLCDCSVSDLWVLCEWSASVLWMVCEGSVTDQ